MFSRIFNFDWTLFGVMASCLVSEADVEDCHDQGDEQEAREGEEQVEEHQTRSNLLAIQLRPR